MRRQITQEQQASILIAGIGNIFLGDDGFGVEVAQRLLRRTNSIYPDGVRVVDFGIRGIEILPSEHHHLLALSSRACLCACNACALLFKNGRQQANYKTIPHRFLAFNQFHLEEEAWEALALPVNMVYIFRTGKGARAFYPSPAGAMESLLGLDDWENITRANPQLYDMEEEVEALLINRVRGRIEYYLVPIDTCYQLVGLIRLRWRGLSGGEEAWEAIDSFFRDLRTRSTVIDEGEQPCQI